MTSTRSFVPNQLFTPPAVGTIPPPPPEQEPGFHFGRAASGPSMKHHPFGHPGWRKLEVMYGG